MARLDVVLGDMHALALLTKNDNVSKKSSLHIVKLTKDHKIYSIFLLPGFNIDFWSHFIWNLRPYATLILTLCQEARLKCLVNFRN